MAEDPTLVDALRDHAETLEQSTSAENDSHSRDIAQAEAARSLAFKIENGEAAQAEKDSVAGMVHPSVKSRYGL